MRRFQLERTEDPTGISGTGTVAEGVVFADGSAVVHWLTSPHASTVVWPGPDAVASIQAIHGHGGRTRILWLDEVEHQSSRTVDEEDR
jgi:hypothetical protein